MWRRKEEEEERRMKKEVGIDKEGKREWKELEENFVMEWTTKLRCLDHAKQL